MRIPICLLFTALFSLRLTAAESPADIHPPVTIGSGENAVEVRTQQIPGRLTPIRSVTPIGAGARKLQAQAKVQGKAAPKEIPLQMAGDRLIVRFTPGVDTRIVLTAAGRGGMRLLRRIYGDLWTVTFPMLNADSFDQAMTDLRRTAGVVSCEPDLFITVTQVPNDTRFNEQWSLRNNGQTGGTSGADIKAVAAWDHTIGSHSVLVGVIDTGVDYTHPDLMANIWSNPGETGTDANGQPRKSNGIDDDGNGFIDDWRGWNFVEGNNDPQDLFGHGTHCAGSIGASGNNGLGITGVAQRVSLVGIRFLDANGGGFISDGISAIDYATRIGCHITSNSWGIAGYSPELDTAIRAAGNAGQLFVAAAGNSATDTDTQPFSPGSLTASNLISVMATDHYDQRAWFSNFGYRTCHIAAPGVNILSTVPGGGYQLMSGTSMATPHVAGACALVKALYPAATASEIKARILSGVRPAGMPCSTSGILDCTGSLVPHDGAKPDIAHLELLRAGQSPQMISPGDALTISARIVNIGTATASGLSLLLESLDGTSGAEVDVEQVNIGDLAPSAWLDNGALAFHIPTSIPSQSQLHLRVTVMSDGVPVVSRVITFAADVLSNIRGRVTSAVDGSPVVGAEVMCYLAATGAGLQRVTTDADGNYSFQGLISGYYRFDSWGWQGWLYTTQYVTVPRSEPVDFVLQPCSRLYFTWEQGVSLEQGRSTRQKARFTNGGQAAGSWWRLTTGIIEESGGLWHVAKGVSHNSNDDTCFAYVLAGTNGSATGTANAGVLAFRSWDTYDLPIKLQFWERGTVAAAGGTCRCEVSRDGIDWTTVWTSTNDDGVWRQVLVDLPHMPSRDLRIRWVAQRQPSAIGTTGGWFIDEPTMILPFDTQNMSAWVRLTPSQGTLEAGEAREIDMDISTLGLPPGSYSGWPQINEDNFIHLIGPSWTVQAAPVIVVGDARIDSPTGIVRTDGVAAPVLALLANQGAMTGNGLTAHLETAEPDLHIAGGTWNLGTLATGTSAWSHPWSLSAEADYSGSHDPIVTLVIQDDAGRSWTHPLRVQVVASNAPPNVTVTRAPTSPSNSSPLRWQLAWNEPVFGFSINDLVLTGAASATLTPQSPQGDGSAQIFTLDVTPAGDGTVSFDLTADTVKDADHNTNVAMASLGLAVSDQTAPTVTVTEHPTDPSNATVLTWELIWNEPVSGFTAYDFWYAGAGSAMLTPVDPDEHGYATIFRFSINPLGDGTVSFSLMASRVTDHAGNTNAMVAPLGTTISDRTPPLVTVTQQPDRVTSAIPLTWVLTSTEPVNDFTANDLVLGGTAAISDVLVTAISPDPNGFASAFRIDVAPTGDGDVSIHLAAHAVMDIAGNTNATAVDLGITTSDRTPPTITVTETPPSPSGAHPLTWQLTWSEPVVGFEVDDLTLTNASGAELTPVAPDDGGFATVFMLNLSPTSDGVVAFDLSADAVVDAAGKTNAAKTALGSTISDRTPPTVIVTLTPANPSKDSPLTWQLTWSEPVTGFTIDDFTLTNGSNAILTPVAPDAGGFATVFTLDLTPTSDGVVVVALLASAVVDTAGNTNVAVNALGTTVSDRTPPTVAVTLAPANPSNADHLIWQLTWNEPVVGFAVDDLTLTGSSAIALTPVAPDGGGFASVFQLDVTPSTDGTIAIALSANAVLDALGHANAAVTALGTTVSDHTPPTVSVGTANTTIPVNGNTSVVLTFSEPVAGVDPTLITVTRGTVSGTITGSGTTWNVPITAGNTPGIMTMTIATGAANDAAGNPSGSGWIDLSIVSQGNSNDENNGKRCGAGNGLAALLLVAGFLLVALRRQ